MSLRQITAEVEQTLRGAHGFIDYARLVDVFLDDRTLHFSDLYHDVAVDDGEGGAAVYVGVGDRLVPPAEITEDQSLDNSTIDIEFDSSRITDANDFLGGILSLNLLQRRVRIRSCMFRSGSNKTIPIWLFNETNGVIDQTPDRISVGSRSTMTFRIASGTFAYLERRSAFYSHTDQQELHPGDTGFQRLAQLVDLSLPWAGEF